MCRSKSLVLGPLSVCVINLLFNFVIGEMGEADLLQTNKLEFREKRCFSHFCLALLPNHNKNTIMKNL